MVRPAGCTDLEEAGLTPASCLIAAFLLMSGIHEGEVYYGAFFIKLP